MLLIRISTEQTCMPNTDVVSDTDVRELARLDMEERHLFLR